ncbi:tripartite tricarboxylate transporter TctB family protein [Roseateles violae]|uniref:Tripartite tricarboxylate transporter TctB family protein n=1 Tax=Roseateles violae TaxID=3058042 RepID=A0ABT8DR71_9BURK|nr:tripartite tricarboxylate transporter TctB family protein [Pelomonas sp. PFR6]MDN3920677.1 tripartite tricarboxylate transporter TctB family protein [Pelomonas sp. PFR6]
MKIKSQRDFWSGLMFVVVGVAFAWASTSYSFGSSARPGAGYFPFGLGVLLAILGAMVLFKALTIESEGGDPVGAFAWRPLIVMVVSIAVFGLLLPRLGMAITLPILVISSALAGDEFHWKDALINAVVLTVFSWIIFVWGLKLVIPVWPVFITG